MIKIFLIIALFFLYCPVRAQSFLKGKAELPQDFSLAMDFLQKNSSSDSSPQDQLKELDYLLARLSEAERLTLLKSELYKSLLKISRDQKVHHDLYKAQTLRNIEQRFEKERSSKDVHPFINLFMNALFKDLNNYINDAEYPNLMASLQQGELSIPSRTRPLKRRLDMLLPWLEWYYEGELPGLREKLKLALELALRLSHERAKNLIFLSQFEDLSNEKMSSHTNLRFFEEKSSSKTPEDKDSPIEQLSVSDEIGEPQEEIDEKWVPRIEPDPNYQAPDKLPEPVDDWLPNPVDDWLNDM